MQRSTYGLVKGNAELTIGATDPALYTGKINYVPLTSTDYWGIIVPA